MASVKYYPFGETRSSSGTLDTDKMFTGQRLDNTGLYYYGARMYDPVIGRFISADSLVPKPSNPQAFNRYSYCLNNPLRYVDPSGHQTQPKEMDPVIIFGKEYIVCGIGDGGTGLYDPATGLWHTWSEIIGLSLPEGFTMEDVVVILANSGDILVLDTHYSSGEVYYVMYGWEALYFVEIGYWYSAGMTREEVIEIHKEKDEFWTLGLLCESGTWGYTQAKMGDFSSGVDPIFRPFAAVLADVDGQVQLFRGDELVVSYEQHFDYGSIWEGLEFLALNIPILKGPLEIKLAITGVRFLYRLVKKLLTDQEP